MRTLIAIGTTLLLFVACKKTDRTEKPGPGKYRVDANWAEKDQDFIDAPDFRGKFKGRIIHGEISDAEISESEINFDGSAFQSSNRKPALGTNNPYIFGPSQGTFEVKPGKTILFTNHTLIYPADFDWLTVLNGEYSCKAKGDSLILNKILSYRRAEDPSLVYQYRLKRVSVKN